MRNITLLIALACASLLPIHAKEWVSPGLGRTPGENRGTTIGRIQSFAFASAFCGIKFETLAQSEVPDFVLAYIRRNTSESEWDFFQRGVYPYMGQKWYLDRQERNAQKIINIFKGCHNTLRILQPSLLPEPITEPTSDKPKYFQ